MDVNKFAIEHIKNPKTRLFYMLLWNSRSNSVEAVELYRNIIKTPFDFKTFTKTLKAEFKNLDLIKEIDEILIDVANAISEAETNGIKIRTYSKITVFDSFLKKMREEIVNDSN